MGKTIYPFVMKIIQQEITVFLQDRATTWAIYQVQEVREAFDLLLASINIFNFIISQSIFEKLVKFTSISHLLLIT